MQNYRVQLKAQAFLDAYILNNASTHVVCVDLMGHQWSPAVFQRLTDEEWYSLDACAILNPTNVDAIVNDMGARGFRLRDQSDTWVLLVRNELPFNLRVMCTATVPRWQELRRQLNVDKTQVLLGQLGIDRHKLGLLASRTLGLKHAWSLGDVNSKRWTNLAPDYGYGLFTSDDAQYRTLCYVDDSIGYADCRPIQSSGFCLLYCRIVLDIPEDRHSLPLSMQLRHTQFKDHMDVHPKLDREDGSFVHQFYTLTQHEETVRALRFIRKRNHNPNQPQWSTVQDRFSSDTWDLIWMWQLAKQDGGVVMVLPRGDLLLAAVRAKYCY